MGRPKVNPIRKKQIRYGAIEDVFKKVIDELKNEEDKEKIEKALMQIREKRKKTPLR